jgi:hypothetical protein
VPYNVYLFNGLPMSNPMNRGVLSPADLTSIQTVLKSYFDQVVKAHDNLGRRGMTNYGSSNVLWLQRPFPTIAAHELLIYLIPAGTTLVTTGKLQQGRPPGQHDGNTTFSYRTVLRPALLRDQRCSPIFPALLKD